MHYVRIDTWKNLIKRRRIITGITKIGTTKTDKMQLEFVRGRGVLVVLQLGGKDHDPEILGLDRGKVLPLKEDEERKE